MARPTPSWEQVIDYVPYDRFISVEEIAEHFPDWSMNRVRRALADTHRQGLAEKFTEAKCGQAYRRLTKAKPPPSRKGRVDALQLRSFK